MIFKKKDMRNAGSPRGTPGYRNYWMKDPVIISVHCQGVKLKSKFIRYWVCKVYPGKWAVDLYPDKRNELLWEFTPSQPGKWQDKWFIEGLNESMNEKGGKQKLIRAIYNDFEA